MTDLEEIVMAVEDAERLTERIRITAHNYVEAREKLIGLVHEAREGNAHTSLGYPSWTAYLTAVLGEKPLRLARDERQDMVHMLSGEGLSTRAIGAIVGVDQKTVVNDLATEENSSVGSGPRAVESLDGKTRTYTPRPVPVAVEPEAPAEEPQKRKRRPITDTADELGWELTRLVEKLERLYADDRFDANKEKVASRLRSHLMRATDTLPGLLDQINH